MKAQLALEDGRIFECRSFTGSGEVGGEVVFNTSMSGYQEVLTDPSYRGQMVAMTYPLIGNYGVNPEDTESDRIQVRAFLIREYQSYPSNFRSTASLAAYLRAEGVLGIEDLDTRALTRHIRNKGALRGFISTQNPDPDALVERARSVSSMVGQDIVSRTSSRKPYRWLDGKPEAIDAQKEPLDSEIWRNRGDTYSVIAFDYGIKYNIIRCLTAIGAEVIVVPASTDAQTIMALNPDGIFLSNGPGDPEPVTYAVQTIKSLLGYRPIFGICLGHQLLGLALNGRTFKLKFGHRGANQPVKNLETGRVEITSQNHGFAVDVDSMNSPDVVVTHLNLNDNTLEGFRHTKMPVLAVQYHPEASPGPHDARYLFDEFAGMMQKAKAKT
jgi:carbamoyl-phosphate synthase small subunit